MKCCLAALIVLGALLLPRLAAAAWPTDPSVNVPLCTATGDQVYPTPVEDGAGGAVVAWFDYGANATYAQRVSVGGMVQWKANGVAVVAHPANAAIVSDPLCQRS